ncbi:hypothetical protein GCM10007304_40930 [Rhodococcoides trifolii]|uniref:Uncharacterized protein n=1 Tax=Rhodococcoides trifolii TaxID=908250 RepID=A0A917G4U5_9NOCA|nr:hypothetical protein GCM10007304_40930 [Rhodococcus trifolii]
MERRYAHTTPVNTNAMTATNETSTRPAILARLRLRARLSARRVSVGGATGPTASGSAWGRSTAGGFGGGVVGGGVVGGGVVGETGAASTAGKRVVGASSPGWESMSGGEERVGSSSVVRES